MEFVLDCSMAMAWCFSDEDGVYTEGVLKSLANTIAHVPPLWNYEVCNVLVQAEKKKRLTKAESSHFLDLLNKLPIVEDKTTPNLSEILTISRNHGISAYDAAYIELALRNGLPIATLDKDLKNAATKEGLKVYKP